MHEPAVQLRRRGKELTRSRVRPSPAEGRRDATFVSIEIGGVRIGASVTGAPIEARIHERYDPFISDCREDGPPRDVTLDIEIDAERRPDGVHPRWVDNPRVEADGGLDAARFRGDGFEAEIDWRRGQGRAVLPDSLAHFDLVLRVALGVELLRRGRATLLHSAAVLRDRWAVAFCGPSGAGKSTVAGISRGLGLRVLADEMVVLSGTGSGTRILGTPFWNGEPASGPAAGIFLLRHAGEHRAERLEPARALPELLSAGGAPLDVPEIQEAFFRAIAALLRRVPAYRLSFRPEASLWDAIDRLPEFAFWRPRGAAAPARPAPAAARPLSPLLAAPARGEAGGSRS